MGLQEGTLGRSPPPWGALFGKLGLRESGAKGDRKRMGSRRTGGPIMGRRALQSGLRRRREDAFLPSLFSPCSH